MSDEKKVPVVYTNSVNVVTSLYDVTLRFGMQEPSSTKPQGDKDEVIEVNVTPVVNVSMSPQHSKALAALLTRYILDYEHAHGVVLPMTESVKAIWDDLIKPQEQVEAAKTSSEE